MTSHLSTTPTHPSRFLTSALSSPTANTPIHLLGLANSALHDLYNTQVTLTQAHAASKKRFVIARAYLDKLIAKDEKVRFAGAAMEVRENLGSAKALYEKALEELEERRRDVESCGREVGRLKGDVAYLTKLIKEREGGSVDRQCSPRNRHSPRAKNHGWSHVLESQIDGSDGGIGLAL